MLSLGAARSRERRASTLPWFSVCLAVCAGVLGCQTYEAAPLALVDHMRAVAERISAPLTENRAGESANSQPENFDLTDGGSLAECEALALFHNPRLRLARERAGVARATKENAGLWQDPVFGFNGAQVLSPTSDLEIGGLLSVTLPISGRLAAVRDRADAAFEVELRRIVDAEWDVRADLRRTYFRWSSLDRQRELLDGLLVDIARLVAIAERLELAGALGKAQSRLIHIEEVERRVDRMNVALEADLARLAVLELVGLAPDAALALQRPRLSALALPAESRLQSLDATSTEVAILSARYRVAEESLRLAIRRQYPDLKIGLGPGSEEEDTRVLLGLSLPLPLWNRNAQGIAQARAARELARVAAEVGVEQVNREAKRAELRLRSTRDQRDAIERSLQPLLDDQAQTIADLADLGEVDTFLLLESLRRRYDAAARLLELEANEAAAAVELIRLVGPAPETDTP